MRMYEEVCDESMTIVPIYPITILNSKEVYR